jgi:prepilin-type N-terminal cleavage/methylation domain-containing protein
MHKRRYRLAPAKSCSATCAERGMTLIEVLIALAILAAVAVTFLIGMTVSSKGAIVSQQNITVDSLAKSQMESIKAQPYIVVGLGNYTTIAIPQDLVNQGYNIGINVGLAPGHTTDDGLQQITVNITQNGATVLSLVSLKTNR